MKVLLRNSFGALTKGIEEDVEVAENIVEVYNVNSKKAAKKRTWKPMETKGQKESDGVGRRRQTEYRVREVAHIRDAL